jgi:hypothetical protein
MAQTPAVGETAADMAHGTLLITMSPAVDRYLASFPKSSDEPSPQKETCVASALLGLLGCKSFVSFSYSCLAVPVEYSSTIIDSHNCWYLEPES